MPVTANRSYRYPARTTTPGVGWLDVQRLAEDVDADMATQVAAFDALPRGILARGRRGSDTGGITSEAGVLRLDDVPIEAGRLIRIEARGSVDAIEDRIVAIFRYTVDGSTPVTTSDALEESIFNAIPVGGTGGTFMIVGYYTPASNETFSVLLTVQCGTSVIVDGTSVEHCDIVIEDLGIDPGDTGVDV